MTRKPRLPMRLSQRKKPPPIRPSSGESDSGFAVFGGGNTPALGLPPLDAHRRALPQNVSDSDLFRKCKISNRQK
jgi:hypothetical protein